LVVDQDTSEVLFSKNDKAVLPIASLTKLMTGVVIRDANLSLDELLTVSARMTSTRKRGARRACVWGAC
jgi:D-alanyl-D-alanine endopeptidase (penicillin-binding protein 7)